MEQISYAHSVKQAKRISRFNANPDSDSGLISLPKKISVGESVTIPDGRVVVHPNLEIDGTLTIEDGGELFVPFGGTLVSSDLVHPVDTIADLRNATGKYKYVYVTGYHTKNDGAFGSHIFRLKGVKTTETDNGGTVIVATIGGTDYVYELQYEGVAKKAFFGVLEFKDGIGTNSENNSFTGAVGEVTVDTSTNRLRVHNGATAGGFPVGDYSVNLLDFAPDLSGIKDSSLAIQNAIDSMAKTIYDRGVSKTALSGTIFIPYGIYKCDNALDIVDGFKLNIICEGGTEFISNSSDYFLKISDCKRARIVNMNVRVMTAITDCIIIEQNNTTTNITPTASKFENLSIWGNYLIDNGIKITYTSADANNEFNEFDSPEILGYNQSAVDIYGYQSHINYFRNVNINGANSDYSARAGQRGFKLSSGVNTVAPSIVVDGGGIGWHEEADFKVTGGNDNGFTVKNISSENSNKIFIGNAGGDISNSNAYFENYRYASDGIDSDGLCIESSTGDLSLVNCEIGTNGTNSAYCPRIKVNSNIINNLTIDNCRFGWRQTGTGNNSTQYNLFNTVSGTYSPYSNVDVRNCSWINGVANTPDDYLKITSGTTFNAYFGNTTHRLVFVAVSQINTINASYPGQEITLLFENTNTTLKHNYGGTGTILLKSGADFTPTVVPYAIKLRYDNSFGRWVEI